MQKIIIIGSSNMDITARVRTLPRPGETIGGGRLSQAGGGKGANQAIAAARLGADVTFVTCVGDDDSGKWMTRNFETDGMDVSKVKISSSPTGTALIFVDDNAENCIAVAPGANEDLLPEDMDNVKDCIARSSFMLLQLEIPVRTVCRAMELASEAGVKIVLNPAPMTAIPEEMFSRIYIISPNETEAEALTGIHIENEADARKAAEVLMGKGVTNVIVTMGSAGSLVCTPDATEFVPAQKVKAVDTTAAGDVYNGALVAALAEGKSILEAAAFATKASGIAVTRMGAQTSAPYRKEIL